MIDGETKLLGLIGSNIKHSLSYCLHNFAIKERSQNAIYLPFSTPSSEWKRVIQMLKTPSFLGANVTLPHKRSVVPMLDRLDPQAQRIGAVNTIVKAEDGSLIGKNSDAPGFLSALKEADMPHRGRDVLVLGAGGAAQAVIDALSGLGNRSIYVYNRTLNRAKHIIAHFQKYHPTQKYVLCSNPTELSMPLLIVQATPLGTPGTNLSDQMPPHPILKEEDELVDLIYRSTPLLEKAKRKNIHAIDGKSMLLHQAAISFSWWFRSPPPVEEMRTALYNHLDVWNAS